MQQRCDFQSTLWGTYLIEFRIEIWENGVLSFVQIDIVVHKPATLANNSTDWLHLFRRERRKRNNAIRQW